MSTQIASAPMLLKLYLLLLLVVSIGGCWSFVLLYTRKYKWRSNDFGRHLVAFSSSLGLFLTYYGVLAIWPGMPTVARDWIRTILFTLLTVVIVWRLVLFGRVTRALEREEKNGSGS